MERTAVYRRALAPTSLLAGGVGILAAAVGWFLGLNATGAFAGFWMAVAAVAAVGALGLMRRQALRDAEPFWSPPARRVVQAMLPSLVAGAVVGLLVVLPSGRDWVPAWWLPPIWMVLYGCALHAAGFFMPRGIRLLGWIFVLLGSALLAVLTGCRQGAVLPGSAIGHGLMGAAFGGLHLAYGIYLLVTEPRKPTA